MDAPLKRLRAQNAADPSVQSTLGSILYGVGGPLTAGVLGGLAAGPLGAAALSGTSVGVLAYDQAIADRLSEDQAMRVALESGGVMAAMTFVAPSLGGRILVRAASGAGLNVGFGAGLRWELSRYMEEIGRPDLAERYRVWDSEMVATDAILGAVFGAAFRNKFFERLKRRLLRFREARRGQPRR